jgi:hypothetical protein
MGDAGRYCTDRVIAPTPHLVFASPRALPKPKSLHGRVVVLDVAFAAASGGGVSFETVTKPFIDALGPRLAAWVDHHDHDRHGDYADDPRFTLATKQEHGACPEMVTPELVRRAGPVDTIVAHLDLDGLYAAAKWILGGVEPYRGADDDARCIDTREGTPSTRARRIDQALRAKFRDSELKRSVVHWLVTGMPDGPHAEAIDEAARAFEARARGTEILANRFVRRGVALYVDARGAALPYDKTDLLLEGQRRAEVAIVHDSGMVTIAARYGSGWDFVRLLALEGGMPTRVTIPESRLETAIEAIDREAQARGVGGPP